MKQLFCLRLAEQEEAPPVAGDAPSEEKSGQDQPPPPREFTGTRVPTHDPFRIPQVPPLEPPPEAATREYVKPPTESAPTQETGSSSVDDDVDTTLRQIPSTIPPAGELTCLETAPTEMAHTPPPANRKTPVPETSGVKSIHTQAASMAPPGIAESANDRPTSLTPEPTSFSARLPLPPSPPPASSSRAPAPPVSRSERESSRSVREDSVPPYRSRTVSNGDRHTPPGGIAVPSFPTRSVESPVPPAPTVATQRTVQTRHAGRRSTSEGAPFILGGLIVGLLIGWFASGLHYEQKPDYALEQMMELMHQDPRPICMRLPVGYMNVVQKGKGPKGTFRCNTSQPYLSGKVWVRDVCDCER